MQINPFTRANEQKQAYRSGTVQGKRDILTPRLDYHGPLCIYSRYDKKFIPPQKVAYIRAFALCWKAAAVLHSPL